MPTNVTLGSTVQFIVEFLDNNSNLTVPSSGIIALSYSPSSNSLTTVSCAIALIPSGSFFTATWGSGVSALGMVNYSVLGNGQAVPTTGQLRIITP